MREKVGRALLDKPCDRGHLCLSGEGAEMDAIIGKYRVSMEESGLILTHPARISFDLTLDEAVELMEFIRVYQHAIAAVLRDTAPCNEGIVTDDASSASEHESGERELSG
jgi:hypothetical protein